MTIRRLLLLAFLAVSLVPAIVVTGLAFVQARGLLSAEIARHMEVQAAVLMSQVDRMLFERIEDIRTWTQLDVMRETRIRDLDKRVSAMLVDLKAGYGVYSQIFCTTDNGEIVAASDPRLLGQRVLPTQPWLEVPSPAGTITLEPLAFTSPWQELHLRFRVPLVDPILEGKPIGMLYALFDWREIVRLLDDIETEDTGPGQGRSALLVDQHGQVIAASTPPRQGKPEVALASWQPVQQAQRGMSGVLLADGNVLGQDAVLVGYAHSQGYQSFDGFGWSLLVVQATDHAFYPVWRMGMMFVGLLVATGVVALGVSLWVATRIARPVVALTDFTRRVAQDGMATAPPPAAGEVGELTRAYTQLIHDLHESRAQLIRAAKLAVAGEMAAAMTHEIRTPLGILRSSAQMLQREPQLSAEGREMTEFVVSETDRLNQLVSSLLGFARPNPPVFALHDVHVILQRTMTMLTPQAERKQVRLIPAFQNGPALLNCDEEQMIQVFLNLFINAFQVLASGGKVTVRTRTAGHLDNLLLVEVADNGPGISVALHHKVFEPFFTTRENGIGLGLTVVQQIVRGHGGTIAIAASSTGGACFRLQFPQERSVQS